MSTSHDDNDPSRMEGFAVVGEQEENVDRVLPQLVRPVKN